MQYQRNWACHKIPWPNKFAVCVGAEMLTSSGGIHTMVIESMGFRPGVSDPCIFYHAQRELMVVVHGNNTTTLGLDKDIDWSGGKLWDASR